MITNITKVIQQFDEKTIREINKVSDIDKKAEMLLSFMDTLQLQVSKLNKLLAIDNTKDNTINQQSELIRQLIEERQYLIQVIDSANLLLNQ